MDLYQLRYFLEVARELNFTRAAQNLHISPPAVSRSVALLERSLGKKLFARTKRRVELTADGEYLKLGVEKIYDDIERIKLGLKTEADAPPAMLRIGSREMITNYLLPGPVLAMRRKYPQTRFGLYELDARAMAEALKKDQLDFGFHYLDPQDPLLEARHLGGLKSHVYASRKLFAKGRLPKTFKELAASPFIAPRIFQGDPALPSVDGFPDHRHPRSVVVEGEFLETHRRFVLDGITAGVLPDLVIKDEFNARKVVRFDGPPIAREIYFLKRRSRALPKLADELCAAVRREIKSAQG
ncbi:MAG: LysR family transcriptional regulator [Elusimicrobia bacterium]|nr:LysR family transcriptional regulator [Elusimicrobiota bacterium]